ncbi:MAG: DUF3267 domain-containing protein [Candidatus Flexifilum sp.]|jgi:hypothetical protein
MTAPIRELPAGYVETYQLVLTDPRLLLRLNLLALLPLGMMLALMGGWIVLIAPGARAALAIPDGPAYEPPWFIAIAAVMVITLPLHELLHGAAIRAFGHRPRYGMKLDKGVLYATADQALFRRDAYIVVALTPLLAITLACLIATVVLPVWTQFWLLLAAALNAGGAIGDLWMVRVLLRFPRSALVRDVEDGFRVYEPTS